MTLDPEIGNGDKPSSYWPTLVACPSEPPGLFGRYGLTGRFADRPDAWRIVGAITSGWHSRSRSGRRFSVDRREHSAGRHREVHEPVVSPGPTRGRSRLRDPHPPRSTLGWELALLRIHRLSAAAHDKQHDGNQRTCQAGPVRGESRCAVLAAARHAVGRAHARTDAVIGQRRRPDAWSDRPTATAGTSIGLTAAEATTTGAQPLSHRFHKEVTGLLYALMYRPPPSKLGEWLPNGRGSI